MIATLSSLNRNSSPKKPKMRGFTLLELLIAVAIFSLLATACYRLFKSVSRTHEVTTALWQQNGELQRSLLILYKDFSQMTMRPIRNEFGDKESSVMTSRDALVTFTRGGWRNFTGARRSELQRVRYVLKGGQLLRRYWETLDRAPNTPYKEQVLMDGVQSFTFKFRDDKKQWHQSWPPVSEKESERLVAVPTAVEFTLVHQRLGNIQQLIPGVTYKFKPKKPKPNDGQGGSGQGAQSPYSNSPYEQQRGRGGYSPEDWDDGSPGDTPFYPGGGW